MHQMKKKFGQNFLRDKNLLEKIVKTANINNKDVIEIGPGMGALTNFLVLSAKSVLAYEVDKDLIPTLEEIKRNNNNFNYVIEDILEVNLNLNSKTHVVANIPYNITSPIIFKILSEPNIQSATLMVQKEVCDRIVATPNNKNYNSLSVIVQYYMDVEKIMNVSKKMFYPVPKVDSAVFKMNRRETNLTKDQEKLFLEIVKGSFHQKRKTLSNNLSFTFNLNKEETNEFLIENDIDLMSRAENVSLHQFIELAKKWRF